MFVSWPLLHSHLRVEHPEADEVDDDVLTVDDILAARPDEPPSEPYERPQHNLRGETSLRTQVMTHATRPWFVAVVAWLWALYGLSHLGFAVADLVMWSMILLAVAGVVALQVWGRNELRLQEDIRRHHGPQR
jgi:hypothetical protein